MAIVPFISKKDLTDLSNIFHKKRMSLKSKPFETALDYLNMIEGIINEAKTIKGLRKVVGKGFQFNPSLDKE